MKIAITSTGKSMDSRLDPRFGRCAYFAIYNTENGEVEFVENPNKNVNDGAGPAAVRLIASHGVEKAVSGEFGFKIKDLMNELNIQMIMYKEDYTIEKIIELIK